MDRDKCRNFPNERVQEAAQSRWQIKQSISFRRYDFSPLITSALLVSSTNIHARFFTAKSTTREASVHFRFEMQCPALPLVVNATKRGASSLGRHYVLAMQSSRVYRNASHGDARRRKSALLRNQSTVMLRPSVVPARVFGPRDQIKFYIRFIYSSKSCKDAGNHATSISQLRIYIAL